MEYKIQKQLKSFGLNDKESQVYVTLLENGSTTASALSTLSGLNRSTTYVQLTSLMSAGLVTSYKDNKKTKFTAESPKKLEYLLDRKIQELGEQKSQITQLLPELMRSFGQHSVTPVIRHFQGKDGLTAMRDELFDSKDAKIRMIMNYDDLQRLYTPDELKSYSSRRKQQTIQSHILYSIAKGPDFKPLEYQHLKRLPDTGMLFGCDVYIYGNTVSFAAMKREIVGVSIDQKDIAQTMKTLFDTYWDTFGMVK